MQKNIGIDIGGTKISIGVVDDEANILVSKRLPMSPKTDPKYVIRQIVDSLHSMLHKVGIKLNDIGFIGVGVPGTVDTKTGIVEYCPNIHWNNVPAGQYFSEMLAREVKICQDSRLAALGELLFGAGRGYHDLVCVTIGTGIGCGIISQRKIITGGMNTAGELGHIVIVPNGRECVCGNRGCLERYCSGTGVMISARERFPEKLTSSSKAEDIFDLAYNDDVMAVALIDDFVDKLAFGISALVNLLSPQIVIISGGMCTHEKLIIEPLKEKVSEKGYIAWTKKNELDIKKAILGSHAPMIGASALYRGV